MDRWSESLSLSFCASLQITINNELVNATKNGTWLAINTHTTNNLVHAWY